MSKEADNWTCRRCGRCCMHMHTDDNGMPCESLLIEGGIAKCQLHGTNLKPDYCRNYPFDGGACFLERDQVPCPSTCSRLKRSKAGR